MLTEVSLGFCQPLWVNHNEGRQFTFRSLSTYYPQITPLFGVQYSQLDVADSEGDSHLGRDSV
jgi:hypothetical protein